MNCGLCFGIVCEHPEQDSIEAKFNTAYCTHNWVNKNVFTKLTNGREQISMGPTYCYKCLEPFPEFEFI